MSRYRKVDPRIWNDAKFRSLTDDGKLVFFFLLTHPHMTAIGAMRASLPGLAAEIGWDAEAFREAFREVSSKGMAEHDESASLIWLPNFIRYNPPESPNVVKAWSGALELLPECDLLTSVVAASVAFAKAMNKGFAEALPEAFSKTMPYQEQEQEQEQEQDKGIGAPPASPPPAPDPTTKRKEVKRATQLPADFYPNATGVTYAEERGVALATELESFRNWHAAKGSMMKDWQAAWRTWCDKAVEFGRGKSGVAGNSARASPYKTRMDQQAETLAALTGGLVSPKPKEPSCDGAIDHKPHALPAAAVG